MTAATIASDVTVERRFTDTAETVVDLCVTEGIHPLDAAMMGMNRHVQQKAKADKKARCEAAHRRAGGEVWWLQEDCPAWCIRDHQGDDTDRWHRGAKSELTLPLSKADNTIGLTPTASVFMAQNTGHRDARILVVPHTRDRSVTLSAAGARELAVELLRLADLADGTDTDDLAGRRVDNLTHREKP